MKQYIFRHEKALSTMFSVINILLQIFGLILILFITIIGMYSVLINITFPISNEMASSFVKLFCAIWASISVIFFFCSAFLDNNRKSYILELTTSAIVGFLAEIFFICFIFSTEIANDTFITFINFAVLFIISSIVQCLYKKFIDCAKREQRLRCLQCLWMIAESQKAAIER